MSNLEDLSAHMTLQYNLLPALCNVIIMTSNFLWNLFVISNSAELGDYDPAIHTPAFVSEFRFVPEQTEEMEIKIIEEYKKIRYFAHCFDNICSYE